MARSGLSDPSHRGRTDYHSAWQIRLLEYYGWFVSWGRLRLLTHVEAHVFGAFSQQGGRMATSPDLTKNQTVLVVSNGTR